MADMQGYGQLQKRLHAIGQPGVMGMLANAVVREQKLLAMGFRKTGNLEHGIVIANVSETSAIIESRAAYSGFVEGGTGLYGPKHQKITPKAAKALRWAVGGSSKVRLSGSSRTSKGVALAGYAFARSVKGRPATPFFFPGARLALSKAGVASIVEHWNSAA